MNESKTVQQIEVDVPIRTAYNQWTQFEEFPKFMRAVDEVIQQGDDRVRFRVKVAGHQVDYDAKILEQVPDQRIVWQSVTGKDTGGVVTFESLGTEKTKISLDLYYAPEGLLERVADLVGAVSMMAKNDLANFKKFIEERGTATGGWRETIKNGNSTPE